MTTLYNHTTGKSLSLVSTDELIAILSSYEKLHSILNSLITASPDRSTEETKQNIQTVYSSYGLNALHNLRNTLDIVKSVSNTYLESSRSYTYSPQNSLLSTIKVVNKATVVMPVHTLQTLTNHDTTLSSKVSSLVSGVDYALQKFTIMRYNPYFTHHTQSTRATFYYLYTGNKNATGEYEFYDIGEKTTLYIRGIDLQEMVSVPICEEMHEFALRNLIKYFTEECADDPIAQALLKACTNAISDILVTRAITQNNIFISSRTSPYYDNAIRRTLYTTSKEEQAAYVKTRFRLHRTVYTNPNVGASLVPETDEYAVEGMYIDTYLELLCNPKSTS